MKQIDEKLLAALRRILRPIVRLLIRNNVTLQPLVDLIKQTYVSVATEEAEKNSAKVTDSQISLMTGVHRKDVKEYRTIKAGREYLPAQKSTGVELVAKWLASPQYLDDEGGALDIPYVSAADAPSFSRLAESVSRDVHPRAILEDLIRLGHAEHDKISDTVSLKSEAFVPREGWADKCYYFGLNNGDHLEAAVANITSPAPQFFDRSVYHDGLSAESLQELKKISSDAAMKMLRLINKKAFELSDKDKGKPGACHRINLGAYFFAEDDKAEDADGKEE